MNEECQHTVTQGRADSKGYWCTNCGKKIYAIDERECSGCKHRSRLPKGSICKKHLMVVVPQMHVTYKIAEGTCWEAAPTVDEDGNLVT